MKAVTFAPYFSETPVEFGCHLSRYICESTVPTRGATKRTLFEEPKPNGASKNVSISAGVVAPPVFVMLVEMYSNAPPHDPFGPGEAAVSKARAPQKREFSMARP